MKRLLAIVVLATVACGEEAVDTGACDRHPPLSYDNFGEGFMANHCAGCHSSLKPEGLREGAPMGVNFDTYGDVVRQVEQVQARVLDEGADMPPGGGPDALELARLQEWLDCTVRPRAEAEGL